MRSGLHRPPAEGTRSDSRYWPSEAGRDDESRARVLKKDCMRSVLGLDLVRHQEEATHKDV